MNHWTFEDFECAENLRNGFSQYSGTDIPKNILQWAPDKLNDPEISYQFNSRGFRTCELVYEPDKFRIVTTGCSFTMGVAVKQSACWPEVLSTKIPDSVLYNLGVGGASIDYVIRSIFVTLDVLKPNLVCVLLPDPARCEVVLDGNIHHATAHCPIFYKNYANDEYQEYQKTKNLEFLKLLCKHNQVPLIICDSKNIFNIADSIDHQELSKFLDVARDGLHYGERWHKHVANKFLSMYNKESLA
jgi:hypothetical protein